MFRRLLVCTFACVVALAVSSPASALDALGNDTGVESNDGNGLPPAVVTGDLVLVSTCPSPAAGNDGLTFDGTYLWIADFNTDRAYAVDPNTCTTVRSIPLPGGYPGGLAWDGAHLWHVDSSFDTVYELDPADGSIIASFPSPGANPTGLAYDGTDLWNSDTNCASAGCTPDQILKMTTGGGLLQTFPAFGTYPTGLAYDGTHLWHSDNVLDAIYKLDPSDLSVLGVYSSPGTFPNDLAWDGNYLWVVDNGTDLLYKYDVGGAIATEPSTWGMIKAEYR